MKVSVVKHLKQLEEENGFEVLLASECSSRAWGYSNPDSDYDVFFLYKKPFNEYQTLFEFKDNVLFKTVTSQGTELTLTGWDISKALKLADKSNPQLMELVASAYNNNHYLYNDKVLKFLNKFMVEFYNPLTLSMSYLSTAHHHLEYDYKRHLATVNVKKMTKHAIAGFRSLLLAEAFLNLNEYSWYSFSQLYGDAYLDTSFNLRSSEWSDTASDLLSDLRTGSDIDVSDLYKFYNYLKNEDLKLKTSPKPLSRAVDVFKKRDMLDKFFVECISS